MLLFRFQRSHPLLFLSHLDILMFFCLFCFYPPYELLLIMFISSQCAFFFLEWVLLTG